MNKNNINYDSSPYACDRCGKHDIDYETLCNECDIYLLEYMQEFKKNEGVKIK